MIKNCKLNNNNKSNSKDNKESNKASFSLSTDHTVPQDLLKQQQTMLSPLAIQDHNKKNNTNDHPILIFSTQMVHKTILMVSSIIITLVQSTLDLLIEQDRDMRELSKNMMKHSEDFKHISIIIQCSKI
ncbi:unnamed protein product [[Candida] boidinii]|nr:unnamed protein product [[Candida] boidinii]